MPQPQSASAPYEHLIDLIAHQEKKRSQEIALVNYKENSDDQSITWKELKSRTETIAQYLIEQDVHPQDKVALFATNSLDWTCADLAILKSRGVVVPIYPTSTLEQFVYIINDAQAKVVFVDDAAHYHLVCEALASCPSVTHVVVCDKTVALTAESHQHLSTILAQPWGTSSLLEQRLQEKSLDDLVTLIYTSGTTGNPKGVMLDYRNAGSMIAQHQQILDFTAGQTSLSFLPLSHIFERGWTLYVLVQGGKNVYVANPLKVKEAMQAIHPDALCVVPRVLEKMYAAILEQVQQSSWIKRALFHASFAVAKCFEDKQEASSMATKLGYRLARSLILDKIKHKIGPKLKMMPCGGAALNKDIEQFFFSVGLPVMCGYGMTETSATVTAQKINQKSIGSTGFALPSMQIKIGEQSEILVKGDTVMKGYYNRPEENEKTFIDGWLKTGDAGFIAEDGQLYLTDRIKELMKTSNGKYIAPQRVEGILGRSPFIEQVAIVAEGRNYVSALIVPTISAIKSWANTQDIRYQCESELLKDKKVLQRIEDSINELQQELARYEQLKKFTLLENPFSIEHGEITPTLKLRRNVIYQKYQHQITAMYS